jgi:hypothetical protein
MKIELAIPQPPVIVAITESKLMAFSLLALAVTVFVLVWRKK